MRIVRVETSVDALELTRPYTIAFRTVDAVRLGFVRIVTARGLVGHGSASPEPFVTGESNADCEAALQAERLDWLVGRDVRHLPALLRELHREMPRTPAARAAVDIALHDLYAQWHEAPLVEVLGRAHQSLPTSITIGIKSIDEAVEEAREYLDRGFRVLKVKLGKDLDEDLERLRALRSAVGPDVGIRVDPNQGYAAAAVLRFVKEAAPLDVEFLEQPMPADAVAEMRTLPEEVRDRIAADESLLSESDALRLVAPPRACGIFNIKLMKCGGVFPATRIADIAELAGVELMWGCMDESVVSIAAALHAALASPATRYLDLDGSFDLARDRFAGGFVLEDGRLRTAGGAGLGVELVPGAEG